MRWLPLLLAAGALHAHEPFLLLTAQPDGTVAVETGFSDDASVEGLKVIVRDRATGATLAEHALPASGKLTLKPPPAPYRVVFEGGPGHRISKPGPEPAVASPAAAPPAPAAAPPSATAAASTATVSTPVAAPGDPAAHADTTRLALVVGVFFLFGTIAFALGYGAGRRSR